MREIAAVKTLTGNQGLSTLPADLPRAAAGQSGVSLVELMVTLALGAIVVLGLTEILASTKATYRREEAFARLQENGRIASMLLAKELRPSRTMPCKSLDLHQVEGTLTVKACALLDGAGCSGEHLLQTGRPLGFDQSELSTASDFDDIPLPAEARTSLAERYVGGDMLLAWGVEPIGVAVAGPLGDGSGEDTATGRINLAGASGLKDGELALISNCRSAHVFAVSNVDDSPPFVEHARAGHAGQVNAADDLYPSAGTRVYGSSGLEIPYNSRAGDPQAWLYPLVYRVFYICCTQDNRLQTGAARDKCRPGSGSYQPDDYRPALCVYDLQRAGGRNQALVPNVADMRVTYSGHGSHAGDPLFSGEAAAELDADAWARVRAASLELLLTTAETNAAAEPRAPTSTNWPPNDDSADRLGAAYPADHRLYQRLRLDVALRPATPWLAKD
jgi:type IV pilus assembly protein PilW